MAVSTQEPRVARVGDTWEWRREDIAAFPATAWTLHYYFKSASANFNFDATADGDYFAVTRTAAETATRAAGVYQWFAFVTDGTRRYQVSQGTIELLPDMAVAGNLDTRSHARKMLDAIDAALLAQAQGGSLALSYTINGRSVTYRDDAAVLDARRYWEAKVRDEEAAEALKNGRPFGQKLLVRLG